MRIGWLADDSPHYGGAERTRDEFDAAKPEAVEIVDCPPGHVDMHCDRYVIHNCVTYTASDFEFLGVPSFKYWNDVGPWVKPDVRALLDQYTHPIYCSPLQAAYMGAARPGDTTVIPPPVDLDRFDAAAGHLPRAGVCSVASWQNGGKGALQVVEWAQKNGKRVDYYGGGPFAPAGSREVSYEELPSILAAHETFVFLPTSLEPFGRVVAEAWAAGCELVTNGLVGAQYWLKRPEKIESAAEDFWRLVLTA